MPLLTRPHLFAKIIRAVVERYSNEGVDAVAALEARGFLFGPTIAAELGVPFVPIRKAGKLPGPVQTERYLKEYGEDASANIGLCYS